MAKDKIRIDQALYDRGMAESRSKAQAYIMAGLVSVANKKIVKSGQLIALDADIHLKGKDHPWVSRGGIKLHHAITYFAINVADITAIDVGSSTGGFTDVLLQSGARKIFAVDSGTNQLAWKLRQDDRVIVHEQTSARILTNTHITETVDIGKGGVVRDEAVHKRVCDEVCQWLEKQNWKVQNITKSPITGPQGNVEFLVWAQNMAGQ